MKKLLLLMITGVICAIVMVACATPTESGENVSGNGESAVSGESTENGENAGSGESTGNGETPTYEFVDPISNGGDYNYNK